MRRSVSKCVSLLFVREQHCGAKRALRWALPGISSFKYFIIVQNVGFNFLFHESLFLIMQCTQSVSRHTCIVCGVCMSFKVVGVILVRAF